MLKSCSVHFPGAVNSKFTTDLAFSHPSTHPAMPTYRVMDSDGIVVDESRRPTDISDEEIISWYKDMVTGMARKARQRESKDWITEGSMSG